MNPLGLAFHHHGLAVEKEGPALQFLEELGYDSGEKIYDPEQNVHVRLCTSDTMPSVELVTPGNGPGPLDAILKRAPEMMYHTCYTTESIDQAVAAIEETGLRCFCVSPPKPAILFNGRLVAFYKVHGFGLIEFLESAVGDS